MNRYTDFFRFANALGFTDENRADLVYEHTNGRTSSLKELTDDELKDITRLLEIRFDDRRRGRRSIVLNLLQKMGVRTCHWSEVDRVCMDPRIAGKKFAHLTIEELDATAIRLRAIQSKQQSAMVKKLAEAAPQSPVIFCRLPVKYS